MSKKAEGFSLRFVFINTGNISRKVLSKVLRSFDKNFERLQKGKNIIFLAISEEHIVGFAQCGLRFDYVEGTDSSPVGYLEGIFVLEEYKKRGYAKELLGRK